jgi:hypothetical protein
MKSLTSTLLLCVLLAGCGGDDSSGHGNQQHQTFTGIVASDDGLSSGELLLEVVDNASVHAAPTSPHLATLNVSGTLVLNGGAPVTLTGTFDTETDELSVSGGGYAFTGVFDGEHGLEGTWTGPGGSGGTFVTTDLDSAKAYCGSYATDDEDDAGTFSFVIGGSILRGAAVSSEDESLIPLDGTVNSNAITIYIPGTTTVLASGTRNGNNVSGVFDDHQGNTGTWSGGACGGN